MTGLSVIIGAILPLFIDLINRKVPNSTYRYYIALGISLFVGFLTSLTEITGLDYSSAEAVLVAGGIVFTAAQTSYKAYWENSDKREKLNLNAKTVNK